MTNADLTHLYFLLDRSGSMQSIREDTVGGFDAFIAEQRTQPGDCRVTLAQFDDRYDVVYADLPIAEVPGLQLQPRGTTALLDAIGRLVTDAGERLAALPEAGRPGTVIVGIMTDGHENASKEWTHAAVRSLIQQQTQTYGWEFLYMGADQDAIEVGTGLGVPASRSMTYSRTASREAMASTSAMVGRVRAARAAGLSAADVGYSDAERRASSR
ncbi:VWA domain-containing protein [Nostocoides sp. F2B08]|uniref:vWA domain-containing protein n=1 Tax=Nostocoides sp. F2B08 TaxID=2653936 RepID=UPI0012632E78|nr:vWA domain-containing protein [Tetrasphaera sp. F2B08]KAB7745662.1 VWA domain-containing protein [Tetrasphaera sp. F2B08]